MFKKEGFGLIELMIVVSIIAIITTLTTTNVHFLKRSFIKMEIDKLYALCMYAQRLAIATGKPQSITFDTTKKSYSCNGYKETLPKDIDFGFIKGVKGPPSAPLKPVTFAITFQKEQITCTPDGIIQPGTIYMVDNQRHNMYALSSPISQVSFLRKYRYDQKWTLLKS